MPEGRNHLQTTTEALSFSGSRRENSHALDLSITEPRLSEYPNPTPKSRLGEGGKALAGINASPAPTLPMTKND